MTSQQQHDGDSADRPRPTRGQRIAAAAFLGAFGLTILTVLLTGLAGLWVRSPRSQADAEPPPPAAIERDASVEAAPPAAQPPVPGSEQGAAADGESGDADAPQESNPNRAGVRAPADGR